MLTSRLLQSLAIEANLGSITDHAANPSCGMDCLIIDVNVARLVVEEAELGAKGAMMTEEVGHSLMKIDPSKEFL